MGILPRERCLASVLVGKRIPPAKPPCVVGAASAIVRAIPFLRILFSKSREDTADVGQNALPDPNFRKEPVLHVVATSHLDTQWRWTFQDTIARYLPATLRENFARFEKYPDYTFSFEGAFRYMLAKEYYPEEYERLRRYITAGRWRVCGSSVDAGDVNTVSVESLVRQTLYGNGFFRDEFGVESCDIFLPDCFGFGWALPTVAVHCGLKGFSTSKLEWGSSAGIPFNLGVWEGVDGSGLIAAINPTQYSLPITTDLASDEIWQKRIRENGEGCGAFVDYKYFGLGDTGGAPDEASIQRLEEAITAGGPTRVVSAGADQLFRELCEEEVARLPRHRGEFLLIEHGVGTFTSNGAMKRWNRKNEMLASMAEAAATMAFAFCGEPYPRERLRNAWVRFLANQMHDILPGTCIPEAYAFSWNDEIVALNEFSAVLSHALSVLAGDMNTETEGTPVLFFNHTLPASCGPVELALDRDAIPAGACSLRNAAGETFPVQEIGANKGERRFLFLPEVAAIGYEVLEVVGGSNHASGATARGDGSHHILETSTLRVRLSAEGDIDSIVEKASGREYLSGPIRLQFLPQAPKEWPAWTFEYKDISAEPLGHVEGPASIRIVEKGPVRATIEVVRSARGSTFTQRISVYTNGIVEIDHSIRWESPGCLLKLAFPFSASNPVARYDIGAGVIERGNNHQRLYEVPALEWAELQDQSGDFGVRIWPEGKFGWDKPDDQTLRLTLLHTPEMTGFECHLGGANFVDRFLEQAQLDFGHHRFRVRLVPHGRDGAKLHAGYQQGVAIPLSRHGGALGRKITAVSSCNAGVEVSALKFAEKSDRVVLRLLEKSGASQIVSFGGNLAPVDSEPVNGMEDVLGKCQDAIELAPYRPLALAYAVKPSRQDTRMDTHALELPFNLDAISTNDNRQDGDIDGCGHSLAAELIPDVIEDAGVPFRMGPAQYRALNCVVPIGQRIPIPEGWNRLHLLMAAVGGYVESDWELGGESTRLTVQDYAEPLGRWDTRVVDGLYVNRVDEMLPAYIKEGRVAWVGTHRHARGSNVDEPYVYTYLFHHVLAVPAGIREWRLPQAPRVRLFAATLSRGGPAEVLWLGVKRFA